MYLTNNEIQQSHTQILDGFLGISFAYLIAGESCARLVIESGRRFQGMTTLPPENWLQFVMNESLRCFEESTQLARECQEKQAEAIVGWVRLFDGVSGKVLERAAHDSPYEAALALRSLKNVIHDVDSMLGHLVATASSVDGEAAQALQASQESC